MKKAEAISILAASVRPREAKDRARYDEAVRMAIEALKCSETPKSSEQNAETAQADHIADTGKMAEQTAEIAQNVRDEDLISRKAAIDAVIDEFKRSPTPAIRAKLRLEALPSAQPEIIRCKDCRFNDGTAYCVFHFRDVNSNDFCSWAERRSDEQAD